MIKSKTFWAGITGLIGAVSGYLTGELDRDWETYPNNNINKGS